MKNLSTKLKKGDILSLTQYCTVDSISGNNVNVTTSDGSHLTYQGIVDNDYVLSADHFTEQRQTTKTELEEIFKSNPRVAMTVIFNKQVKEKDVATQIANLYPNKGKIISQDEFTKLAKKIAKDVIKGEERLARGWHEGNYGVGGRLYFTDMDKDNDLSKDYDTRMILVDPRTLIAVIANGVKYVAK